MNKTIIRYWICQIMVFMMKIKNTTILQNFYVSHDKKSVLDSKELNKQYGIIVPRYHGVQFYCDYLNRHNGYIHNCGYCMFYNFIAIQKTIEHYVLHKRKHID